MKFIVEFEERILRMRKRKQTLRGKIIVRRVTLNYLYSQKINIDDKF